MWSDLTAFLTVCIISLAGFLLLFRVILHLISQNRELETKLMHLAGAMMQPDVIRGRQPTEEEIERAVFTRSNGAARAYEPPAQ